MLMSVLAANEPISPELVLVSPPEVAQLARNMLSVPVWRPVPISQPGKAGRALGRIELAAVWSFCLVMTVGPMMLFLGLRSLTVA